MRFRTSGFGIKKNFLGKVPASAFQAFTLGQGQRIVLAERTEAKIQAFNVPRDLTIHFQLNPDGSMPQIAAVGQRLIRNISQGGMHAYQNRRDLQTLVTALFNDGLTQTQLAHRIDMSKAVPAAIDRLRKTSPSFDQIFSNYEVSAHKVRLMASEDPRLATDDLFEGAHVHENLPDTFVQKGAWVQMPDGELRFAGFGNTMAAFSRDADGDYMLLYHIASKTGDKSFAIGHKYPGYKRHGYMEVEHSFDLGSVLKHAEREIFKATPNGFKGAVRTHEYSGLGFDVMLQKLQHRTALDRKMRAQGLNKLGAEDRQAYIDLVKEQLIGTSDTGRQHTKVVMKELYEAMGESLKKGEMTPAELQEFFSSRMNIGNFRFEQLELKILKSAKNGGAVKELYQTNLEEFRMVLTEAANFGVMGYKKLGSMSAVDKRRMLESMVGPEGMAGFKDLNSDSFKKMEEAFMYPLAALKRLENPFVESLYKGGVQKRMAGQRTFFEVDAGEGIYETMMRSGLYEMKPILTPTEFLSPELQPHFQGLQAVFQRGFEDELYSPVGGFGTMLPGGAQVINTPVLRTSFTADVSRGIVDATSGAERARRHLNKVVSDKFKFRYQNSNHTVRFGKAEGIFSKSNVASDRNLARRLAEGFVVNSPDGGKPLDTIFTGAAANLPFEVRKNRMAEYIQQVAAHGTEEDYRTLLARSHSLLKGGKKVAKRFQQELKDVSVLLGPDVNVTIGRSGQARMGSNETLMAVANQASILLPHETNDVTEFAEARALIERNLKIHFSDAAAMVKEGIGTVMEMGSESGQAWKASAAFGSAARRVLKISPQTRQSVQVRDLTLGYINIDTLGMLKNDPRFAHYTNEDIINKYLNSGDGLTNRLKEFGEGSAFLPDDFRIAASAARAEQPIEGLKVRHIPTEEEVNAMGLISTMERNPNTGIEKKVWYQPAFNGDFREMPKVVDEYGRWKIEPTHIKSARTAGGEVIHGLMPIGEAYGKGEGGLAGLIFENADKAGMTRADALSFLTELAKEEAEITSMKNILTPEQTIQRLEALRKKAFLRVGFTKEQIEITLANDEKVWAESVLGRGSTLGAAMTSTERLKEFDPKSEIQIGSAPGSEALEQTAADFHQVLVRLAGEHGISEDQLALEGITKDTIRDTFAREGIDYDLLRKGQENIQTAMHLEEMFGIKSGGLVEAMGRTAKTSYSGAAERMGQAAAAAESIGGIAMSKTAEHLGSLMATMSSKAKAAPLAVVAGASLLLVGLQNHHDKEKRRHRPFLPR